MRGREWYGWHFPELGKIITDNIAYIRTVHLMGTRDNCKNCDLSDILPEEIEARVKEAAEISMGTEISDIDLFNIRHLCDQVGLIPYKIHTGVSKDQLSGHGDSRIQGPIVRVLEKSYDCYRS